MSEPVVRPWWERLVILGWVLLCVFAAAPLLWVLIHWWAWWGFR